MLLTTLIKKIMATGEDRGERRKETTCNYYNNF